MSGNPTRSELVEGSFRKWISHKGISSSDYHRLFKAYRYGFMDGELMVSHESGDPAYMAGYEAGRVQYDHGFAAR